MTGVYVMGTNVRDFFVTGGALRSRLAREMLNRAGNHEVLRTGMRLERFELLDRIGSGGCSEVYRAVRCDGAFEHQVAIKVIRQADRLRFAGRREREVLARLRHPGIATILDGGELPDGTVWFAMEYIDGAPLDEHCEQHRLSWVGRCALLREIARSVDYAHRSGVVHGDIKPQNVMVDKEGHAKLLDFGIAAEIGPGTVAASDEHLAFTFAFASPEQLNNSALTPASDIYQLGLLVECLLLDDRHPSLLKENVAALIARATASVPADRYATAAELERDLHRLEKSLPVRARQWSWIQHLRMLTARMPRTTLGLALLAMVLLTAFLALERGRATVERDAQQYELSAKALELFLNGLIAEAHPSLNTGDRLAAIAIVDQVSRRLRSETLLAAEMRFQIAADTAEVYIEAFEPLKALEMGSALLAVPGDPQRRSGARIGLILYMAEAEFHRSNYEAATRWLDQASTELGELGLNDAKEQRVKLLLIRGDMMGALQQEGAEATLLEATRLAESSFGRHHRIVFEAHDTLGSALMPFNPELAATHLAAAHEIGLEVLGRRHKQVLNSQITYGRTLAKNSRVDEGEALIREAIAVAQTTPLRDGPDYVLMGYGFVELAALLWTAKRYEECEVAAKDASKAYENLDVPDEYLLAPLSLLGRCVLKQGRAEEAIPVLQRNVELTREVYGKEHSFALLEANYDLAQAALAVGAMELAGTAASEVLALLPDSGLDPAREATRYLLVARVRALALQTDDAKSALSAAERALDRANTRNPKVVAEIASLRATLR